MKLSENRLEDALLEPKESCEDPLGPSDSNGKCDETSS